jgi:hypothetical protein
MPAWSFRSIKMFVLSAIPFQSLRSRARLQLQILVSFSVCLSFCLFAFLSFSIFEIKVNLDMPLTKKDLIPLLNASVIIPFHKNVCPQCHTIPKSKEWATAADTSKIVCLSVFTPFSLSLFLRSKRTWICL